MKTRREFLESTIILGLFWPTMGWGRSILPSKDGYRPNYLKLHENGELKERGEKLFKTMSSCELCPRECGVDRLAGERGVCGADGRLRIASYGPHHGEEAPLSGTKGSGTIFLSHCALRCVFCINADISHGGSGTDREIEDMAGMMMVLQEKGCHNINVVTPTHYLPHILLALDKAAGSGLKIPFVYNTCGWEKLEILRELDGVVDIYLPDFKYWDPEIAKTFSAGASTYPKVTMKALIEMNRQVGTAHPGPDGLMKRGLMIRHLVMPNGVSGSEKIMRWIGENLPKDTYINIMSQYTPAYRAKEYREISRRLMASEYRSAVRAAREAGLTNLDIQGSGYILD